MKLKNLINKYKHPSMRLVKAKAKELMLSGENHLTLIFSLVVTAVSVIIPLCVFSLIYELCPYAWVDAAMLLTEYLVLSPLLYGITSIASGMADGEDRRIVDLFEAFSSLKMYKRSLKFGLAVIVAAAALSLLAGLPLTVSGWLESAGLPKWVAVIVGIAGTLASAPTALWLFCRASLFPLLMVREYGVFWAIKRSFVLTKGKGAELFLFALGFLPLVLVSVLAVFVPMLIYTAPYMLCVWAIGAKTIRENNERLI